MGIHNTYEPEASSNTVIVQNTVRDKGVSKMGYSNGNAHVSSRQFASQIKPQIQYVDEVHARVSEHDEGNNFGSSNSGNFGSSSTGSFGSSSTGSLGSSITGRSSTHDTY